MEEVYSLIVPSNDHHETPARYQTRSGSKENLGEREDCESTAVMPRKHRASAKINEQKEQDLKSSPQGSNSSYDHEKHGDRVSTKLQHQLHLLEQAHYELRLETRELTQWKLNAQEEVQDLLGENASLRQTLQTCRNDLFKLQPPAQTADSELSQTLEALDQSICGWIENEICHYEKSWPKSQDIPPLYPFLSGGIPGAEDLLKTYPNTGEYLILRSIHIFLQKEIFHESVDLCGLSPRDAVLFKVL